MIFFTGKGNTNVADFKLIPNPAFQAVEMLRATFSTAGCALLTCGYENLTLRVIRITDFDAVALIFNYFIWLFKKYFLSSQAK
jgi:hypothetical protein